MHARARAVTLLNYPELARCVGVDPYPVLAHAGLRPGELKDADNWLPGEQILRVLNETALRADRDDFGVLLGEHRSFASLGPVSLLLKHELTLRTIINSMIAYRRLINELLLLRLEENGRASRLVWGLIPGLRSSQGVNLLATMAYRVIVQGTAIPWRPDCIHFRHRTPRQSATFARLFDCRLEFDSSFDGMSFRSSSLALRNASADRELAAHARRLLSLIPAVRHEETTIERARGTISLLLESGRADAANVARCLGMSVRTFQRRLSYEGQTFSGLLNECRRELSLRYLAHSDQSVTAVAELTGYSTLSAFSHWFVSEFRMPPGKWRKANLPRSVEPAAQTLRAHA